MPPTSKNYSVVSLFQCMFVSSSSNKFLATFPYPYMNGRLHLGHTYSLSKCEVCIGCSFFQMSFSLFSFSLPWAINVSEANIVCFHSDSTVLACPFACVIFDDFSSIRTFCLCSKAGADKLQRELKDFGYPPEFPADTTEEVKEEQTTTAAQADGDIKIEDKSKSKKVCI